MHLKSTFSKLSWKRKAGAPKPVCRITPGQRSRWKTQLSPHARLVLCARNREGKPRGRSDTRKRPTAGREAGRGGEEEGQRGRGTPDREPEERTTWRALAGRRDPRTDNLTLAQAWNRRTVSRDRCTPRGWVVAAHLPGTLRPAALVGPCPPVCPPRVARWARQGPRRSPWPSAVTSDRRLGWKLGAKKAERK